MAKTFVIDCYAENRNSYPEDYAVIAIDVIRSTTTATTALYLGRYVYPALNADEALMMVPNLKDPLLVGEMGGHVPFGFHMTNSPVQVMALSNIPSGYFTNIRRPLILVSSSGIPLVINSVNNVATYLACLRNYKAVAKYVSERHEKVAIIGAGTRGEFRLEDQIGCAWLAEQLQNLGFEAENDRSNELVEKWHECDVNQIREGNSANYLIQSGQAHDLEFIIHHVDDLNVVPKYSQNHFEDVLQSL